MSSETLTPTSSLLPVQPVPGKIEGSFVYAASYKFALKLMAGSTFLDDLKNFPKEQINDETVELLFPYLEMPDFTVANAKKASGNMAGLCAWCDGMATYQQVAKVVGPKMDALKAAERSLAAANKSLAAANAELDATQAELDKMQLDFDTAMAEKQKLLDAAEATKKRMDAANALINGLAGEKARWTDQLADFAGAPARTRKQVSLTPRRPRLPARLQHRVWLPIGPPVSHRDCFGT